MTAASYVIFSFLDSGDVLTDKEKIRGETHRDRESKTDPDTNPDGDFKQEIDMDTWRETHRDREINRDTPK